MSWFYSLSNIPHWPCKIPTTVDMLNMSECTSHIIVTNTWIQYDPCTWRFNRRECFCPISTGFWSSTLTNYLSCRHFHGLLITIKTVYIWPHLSTVATSEQNEDRSWGDGGTQIPLVLAEGLLSMAFQFAGNILCGVVAGLQRKFKYIKISKFAAKIQ